MNERKKDALRRILVVGSLFCWVLFTMLTLIGCGGGSSSNITGPSVNPNAIVLDSSKDEDLKLVKMYNSDLAGGYATKWTKSTVSVYDSTGQINNLQSILNDWNSVLSGKLTLVIGGPGSDIEITRDDQINNCGITSSYHFQGWFSVRQIKINLAELSCTIDRTVKHEIGHSIGFIGHTFGDGLMDLPSASYQIGDIARRTIVKLYSDSVPAGSQIV